jgi:hypothetical protein
MFESFAQDYEPWRQFFIDHSHRILFGTDTISDHWRETVSCLRRVMETSEEFVAFEEQCRGLALDGDALKDIYQHNFDRYLLNPPRPMNLAGLRAYGQSLYPLAAALGSYAQKAAANINEALATLGSY